MKPIRPKKRFGQNFLRDRQVIDRIIDAAQLAPDDRVLEIGPGLGVLTEQLLAGAGLVQIVEIDRDLADQWLDHADARLRVVQADVLAVDWPQLLGEPPWKLVANLPYNISSQVVFRVLEHRRFFSRLVLMFQKEVGERLLADPGGKDYGILSVFCQLWFDIRRVVKVPPGAFYPAPKVDSVVLCFTPLAEPRVPVNDEPFFRQVVKAAFAQRRKTLRNTLKTGGFSSEQVALALERAGIDHGRRAETLDLNEFRLLAEALKAEQAAVRE